MNTLNKEFHCLLQHVFLLICRKLGKAKKKKIGKETVLYSKTSDYYSEIEDCNNDVMDTGNRVSHDSNVTYDHVNRMRDIQTETTEYDSVQTGETDNIYSHLNEHKSDTGITLGMYSEVVV